MSIKILTLVGLVWACQIAFAVSYGAAYSFRGHMFEANFLKPAHSSREMFATDLFKEISKDKIKENVIVSPISIQATLAMAYVGAEGETATELKRGLRLQTNNKDDVGEEFLEVLREKKGDTKLSIANKIYVSSKYQLRSTYNDFLKKYFNSEAEVVNFSQSADAVKTINSWIGKATDNKITNIIQPGSVDGGTSALIVNAIYFKGNWKIPFKKDSTRKRPFWVSKTNSVETDIMYAEEKFMYGQFPYLDATAIEMAYKYSDFSMLIVLPNERDGLAMLEEKLSFVAINELSSRMRLENVDVFLPKFKFEFITSMTDKLKALGIRSIFGDNADLSGICESGPPIKVSDMQHNIFIDVNEAGTEAAAISFMFPQTISKTRSIYFNADHPFVFAIKSRYTVYFVGHIAQF